VVGNCVWNEPVCVGKVGDGGMVVGKVPVGNGTVGWVPVGTVGVDVGKGELGTVGKEPLVDEVGNGVDGLCVDGLWVGVGVGETDGNGFVGGGG
jgi:hypothetical protein